MSLTYCVFHSWSATVYGMNTLYLSGPHPYAPICTLFVPTPMTSNGIPLIRIVSPTAGVFFNSGH
jgi:hypothetical protein